MPCEKYVRSQKRVMVSEVMGVSGGIKGRTTATKESVWPQSPPLGKYANVCDHRCEALRPRRPDRQHVRAENPGTFASPPLPSIRGPLFLSFTLHGFTIILFSPHNFASRIVQPEPCLSASLEECNGCFLRSPLGNPSLLPSQAQQVLSHRQDAVIFIFNDCPYVANVMLCPQKRYLEVLTTFECDLIWKKHLCRWNQVKMRSDWVRAGPKPNDWCPYRRAM